VRSKSLLLSAVFAVQLSAGNITGLFYTSAPHSWIGGGQTVTALPTDGFTFDITSGPARAILGDSATDYLTIGIKNYSTALPWYLEPWWNVSFAMPMGQTLAAGTYAGVTEFPFQPTNAAGLRFEGNGRADDQITGGFQILEIDFDGAGQVDSFAADFLQNDETHSDWWNVGSIRYNSDAPLAATPEPSATALSLFGICVLGFFRGRHVYRSQHRRRQIG
jgi:hypothetical protein